MKEKSNYIRTPRHALFITALLPAVAREMADPRAFHFSIGHDHKADYPHTKIWHSYTGEGDRYTNQRERAAFVRHDVNAHVPTGGNFIEWKRITVELADIDKSKLPQVKHTRRWGGVFYPDDSWQMEFGPNEKPTKHTSSMLDVVKFIAEFLVNNTILESPYANGKHQEGS